MLYRLWQRSLWAVQDGACYDDAIVLLRMPFCLLYSPSGFSPKFPQLNPAYICAILPLQWLTALILAQQVPGALEFLGGAATKVFCLAWYSSQLSGLIPQWYIGLIIPQEALALCRQTRTMGWAPKSLLSGRRAPWTVILTLNPCPHLVSPLFQGHSPWLSLCHGRNFLRPNLDCEISF